MAVKALSLKTLPDMNGGQVETAFNHHLRRAIEDCEDRPGEKKARKVTLVLEITPIPQQDGAVVDCQAVCDIKGNAPNHVSSPIVAQIRKGGIAAWNDLSEDNPAQHTLDEQEG